MTDLAHTPSPAAPAGPAGRHLVGAHLRALRTARSLLLEDVAAHIGVRPSTLSRIETGQAPLKTAYLALMLDLYDITDPAHRADLTGMARDGQRQNWWAVYGDLLPASASHYLSLEAAATRVCSYHTQAIPGLLQTPAYAAAAAIATRPGLTPAQAHQLARLQARRQQLLHHGTPRVHLLIDQAALTRPIAPAHVIAAQLDHIRATAASPALTIQITNPTPPLLSPSFTLLSLTDPDQPATACCPAPAGHVITTRRRADIHAMHATWQALTRAALTPDAAAALLDKLTTTSRPHQRPSPARRVSSREPLGHETAADAT